MTFPQWWLDYAHSRPKPIYQFWYSTKHEQWLCSVKFKSYRIGDRDPIYVCHDFRHRAK